MVLQEELRDFCLVLPCLQRSANTSSRPGENVIWTRLWRPELGAWSEPSTTPTARRQSPSPSPVASWLSPNLKVGSCLWTIILIWMDWGPQAGSADVQIFHKELLGESPEDWTVRILSTTQVLFSSRQLMSSDWSPLYWWGYRNSLLAETNNWAKQAN